MRIGYVLAAGLAAPPGGPVHAKEAPALSRDQIDRIEATAQCWLQSRVRLHRRAVWGMAAGRMGRMNIT